MNRDSGTDRANGGWLQRLVRPPDLTAIHLHGEETCTKTRKSLAHNWRQNRARLHNPRSALGLEGGSSPQTDKVTTPSDKSSCGMCEKYLVQSSLFPQITQSPSAVQNLTADGMEQIIRITVRKSCAASGVCNLRSKSIKAINSTPSGVFNMVALMNEFAINARWPNGKR